MKKITKTITSKINENVTLIIQEEGIKPEQLYS